MLVMTIDRTEWVGSSLLNFILGDLEMTLVARQVLSWLRNDFGSNWRWLKGLGNYFGLAWRWLENLKMIWKTWRWLWLTEQWLWRLRDDFRLTWIWVWVLKDDLDDQKKKLWRLRDNFRLTEVDFGTTWYLLRRRGDDFNDWKMTMETQRLYWINLKMT